MLRESCPLACPSPEEALRALMGMGSHLPRAHLKLDQLSMVLPGSPELPGPPQTGRNSSRTVKMQCWWKLRQSLHMHKGKGGDSVPTKPSCLVAVRLKARIPAWIRSWSLVLYCPYSTRKVLSTDGGSRCGKQCSGAVTEPTNVFF